MVPFSTPCHLQDAANKELDKLLKSGVLEPVEYQLTGTTAASSCKRTPTVDRMPKHVSSPI